MVAASRGCHGPSSFNSALNIRTATRMVRDTAHQQFVPMAVVLWGTHLLDIRHQTVMAQEAASHLRLLMILGY